MSGTALYGEAAGNRDAEPSYDLEGVSALVVADILGLPENAVAALAGDGLLGPVSGAGLFARRSVAALAEQVWLAALPTAHDAFGLRLRDAVEAAGVAIWPRVIFALLEGRINAFRRRGSFSCGVLSTLLVSSERVIEQLAPSPDDADEPPFIWMPNSPH